MFINKKVKLFLKALKKKKKTEERKIENNSKKQQRDCYTYTSNKISVFGILYHDKQEGRVRKSSCVKLRIIKLLIQGNIDL